MTFHGLVNSITDYIWVVHQWLFSDLAYKCAWIDLSSALDITAWADITELQLQMETDLDAKTDINTKYLAIIFL